MNNQIPMADSPSPAALQALVDLSISDEKSKPVAFVGRENIRRHIRSRFSDLRQNPRDVWSWAEVIQGAPGVGKTSLLDQIRTDNKTDEAVVLAIFGEDMFSPRSFVRKFLNSYDIAAERMYASSDAQQEVRLSSKREPKSWDIAESSMSGQMEDVMQIWSVIGKALKERTARISDVLLKRKPSFQPILLLVDETQDIAFDDRRQAHWICSNLFKGNTGDLRILPVFAGLNDTCDQLSQAGGSRLGRPSIHLGELSREDSIQAVSRFLNSTEYELGRVFTSQDRSDLSVCLGLASEGWPRHLHCYMRSFAIEVVDSIRNEKTNVGMAAVLDRGHRERVHYCEDRINVARLHYRMVRVLCHLARESKNGVLHKKQIFQYAMRASDQSEQMIEDDLARAVHAGVIDTSPGVEKYMFPVPSFLTFMREDCDSERTLNQMRETLRKDLAEYRDFLQLERID